MKKTFLFTAVLFICTLFFISCKDSPTDALISAKISGKVTMKNDTIGISGIKFYLLDAGAKIDTATYNNKHVYLDSTITDSTGRYEFKNLKPGKYAIYPVEKGYLTLRFAGNDTLKIFNLSEGESVVKNFNALMNIQAPIAYELYLKLENLPASDFPNRTIAISEHRRAWVLFVPFPFDENYKTWSRIPGDNSATFYAEIHFTFIQPPYCYLFYSMDNYIQIDICDVDANGKATIKDLFRALPDFSQVKNNFSLTFDYKTKSLKYGY